MKSFNLSEWAVTHRPMVLFLIIATLVLGLASFTKLGRLEDPSFEVPTMTAVVAWPGATAQQVQDEVLNRMERELQEIDGVDYIRSFSRQGYGGLTLWMKGGTSKKLLDAAWYQARKKIGDVRGEFPDGVRGPFFNDEFTDVYTVLYALRAPELQWPELQALAEELKRGLQSVPGVNKVDLLGRQAQQVHVEFSSRRLAALGLTPQSLIDALSRQNAMTPAGAVEGSAERTFVRISGAVHDVADIEALPIEAGGRLLRLSDVATVRNALEDPPTFTVRHNGEAVLALGVTVSRSSNLLVIGKALDARQTELQARLPAGVRLEKYADQPTVVEAAVWEFERSFLEALAIVLVVSFVALGWRTGPGGGCLGASRPGPGRHRDVRRRLGARPHFARGAHHRARLAGRRRHHRRRDDGGEDGTRHGPRQGGDLRLHLDRAPDAHRHDGDGGRLHACRLRAVHLGRLRRRYLLGGWSRVDGVVVGGGGVHALPGRGAAAKVDVQAEHEPRRGGGA
jgi:multidrug efflux pump